MDYGYIHTPSRRARACWCWRQQRRRPRTNCKHCKGLGVVVLQGGGMTPGKYRHVVSKKAGSHLADCPRCYPPGGETSDEIGTAWMEDFPAPASRR